MAVTHPVHHLASFQFGNVTFTLDNDEFRLAFFNGRRYYYSDIVIEFPERATALTATDVFSQITVHDKKTGHYHLDAEGIDHPVEILGIFLGYATAHSFPKPKRNNSNDARKKQTAS